MIICPAEECSRQFKSFKALSAHIKYCRFMPGVLAATATHYAELDRPRKRQRTSFSPAVGDEEEQGDAEAADFEVSHDGFTYPQFLRVHQEISGFLIMPYNQPKSVVRSEKGYEDWVLLITGHESTLNFEIIMKFHNRYNLP